MNSRAIVTVGLLVTSNLFMTIAWYGHLKFKNVPLWKVVIVSWGIALLEYCFQVPANRIGYGRFTATQLKTIQEIVTLTIFVFFSWIYLKESVTWNQLVGFGLIVVAAYMIFARW